MKIMNWLNSPRPARAAVTQVVIIVVNTGLIVAAMEAARRGPEWLTIPPLCTQGVLVGWLAGRFLTQSFDRALKRTLSADSHELNAGDWIYARSLEYLGDFDLLRIDRISGDTVVCGDNWIRPGACWKHIAAARADQAAEDSAHA